jgi:hypothetical protein
MSVNQLKQLSVRDASLNLRVEDIHSTTSSTGAQQFKASDIQNITQQTNISTNVDCGTAPKHLVLIQTQQATQANGSHQFQLLNSLIVANSIVKVSIANYSGIFLTNGIPIWISDPEVGQVTLCVYNPSANAMAGTFRIFVEIIQTEVV